MEEEEEGVNGDVRVNLFNIKDVVTDNVMDGSWRTELFSSLDAGWDKWKGGYGGTYG